MIAIPRKVIKIFKMPIAALWTFTDKNIHCGTDVASGFTHQDF
jgi:hypothetical protein